MNFCFLAMEIKLLAFTSGCKYSENGIQGGLQALQTILSYVLLKIKSTTSSAHSCHFLRINTQHV